MKAREVLNRYAAGERDFRRADLRGQSFRGQDLSGADFSEADIRGTNFSNAVLKETNFTKTKAGVQKQWLVGQFIAASWLSNILSITSIAVNKSFIEYVVTSKEAHLYTTPLIALTLFINVIIIYIIARQGFTDEVATGVSLVGLLGSLVTNAVGLATFQFVLLGTLAPLFIYPLAVSKTASANFVFAGVLATVFTGTGAVVLDGAFAILLVRLRVGESVLAADAVVVGIFLASIPISVVSFYIIGGILKGSEEYKLAGRLVLAFTTIGGTAFCDADLTNANFTGATLRSTDFNGSDNFSKQRFTCLNRVCWKDARDLNLARFSNSILANSAVRELLVTRNGYKKTYIKADLRGVDLDGVNLDEANLKWADLSEATLHHANLRSANLTETRALGTDFTRATLTGACLEAWNIDHHTKLDHVDCQYVYLLQNQQERRPSSGDFAPQEFTKLFEEVLSTVDLIFRNGIDWKAFVSAFKQVQVENEDTSLEIQSIENKGDGVVVVRVNVPPDTNKENIHAEFNQQYELALKAIEARYQAELQAKDSDIAYHRQQNTNMLGAISSLANRPISIINENKLMSNSSDQSRNINVGANLNATDSTFNLGEISGSVTNTINQLPDAVEDDRPNLKELLTQLQEAIETDTDLPDPDKADLLEQVQNLAAAKQTEEPAKKESLTRKAKKIFEATLKGLPATATIVEASSNLLPLILKALGFSV
jgi:uncharacterized protein YjbI with pentapeptide repeats